MDLDVQGTQTTKAQTRLRSLISAFIICLLKTDILLQAKF